MQCLHASDDQISCILQKGKAREAQINLCEQNKKLKLKFLAGNHIKSYLKS
uniref:Uncharacterized protein n=1 Tax=Rhizophora mucronata TaxID=61149 RepID=A0A2P2IIE9_RHIMU